MSSENENKKGCTTITILGSILIIGLIARLIFDTEELFKDVWGVLMGVVVILIFISLSKTF